MFDYNQLNYILIYEDKELKVAENLIIPKATMDIINGAAQSFKKDLSGKLNELLQYDFPRARSRT